VAGFAPVAGNDGRALQYALLGSIALHGVVLFGLPELQSSINPPAPPPLQGRLLEEPALPEAREPAKLPPVARPSPKVLDPVPALPAPAAATQPSTAPAAVEAPPAQPVTATAAPPAPGVADARPLGEYRRELIDAAGRFKRYPPLARENNWAGSVLVRVAIGADSSARLSVKKGSGHQVLDEQALDMFGQAARVVAVPAALRGKPFALEVRAIYGLED
jgi:periplasmic protein TonB